MRTHPKLRPLIDGLRCLLKRCSSFVSTGRGRMRNACGWGNIIKIRGILSRSGEYYQDQGFLFAQDDGNPMHPDSVTDWLAKFSKRHGLPHINPHAFRHTMASMLYFNGVDSVSISKRLGHAQVSTTANIYAHVMEAADKKNADILADVFLKKA